MVRTLCIIGTLLFLTLSGVGQLALPCANFQDSFAPNIGSINGNYSTLCFLLAPGSQSYTLSDPNSRTIQTLEGHITQEFHYIPEGVGEFNVVLAPPGSRGEMEGVWYEPADTYIVPRYEKVEWGIQLPDVVQQAIDNWVYNDQHPTATPLSPTINPFNPEEIDIWADIHYGNEYYRANGFYYVPFERHTVYTDAGLDDPDDWYWQQLTTPHPFRIRYAPVAVVQHTVAMHCHVPGMGTWHIESFRFDVGGNDLKKSFISKSLNKKYFTTADSEVFFPVGQNLAVGGCECDYRVHADLNIQYNETDCAQCYAESFDSPCCGLDEACAFQPQPSFDWRASYWRGMHADPRKNGAPVAGFMKFYQELEGISDAGANAYKLILTPISYEIEFEKLNNYYDRQYMAWELDYTLEHSRNLDLRVELCLMYHPILGHGFSSNWDWSDLDDTQAEDLTVDACGKYAHKRMAYAYYKESALTGCTADAISFFSSSDAKKYYKRKLRYLIARYGYSTRITNLIFISEANNVGLQSGDIAFWQGITGYPEKGAYENYPANQQKVGDWHIEMAQYIRQSLGHTRHLIGSSYAGPAPKGTWNCTSITAMRDRTYESEDIDFISYSNYDGGSKRFQTLADWQADKCNWYKLLPWICNYQQNNGEFNPYREIHKAVIHSEQGIGVDYANEYDYSISRIDPWVSAFAGLASSGMNWGKMYKNSLWQDYSRITDFIQNKVFNGQNIHTTNDWAVAWTKETQANGDDPGKAEAIYLYNRSHGDYGFGILINKTFNPRTGPWRWPVYFAEQDTSEYMHFFKILDQDAYWFEGFETIHYTDNTLRLKGFANSEEFLITYYNPNNLSDTYTSVSGNSWSQNLHLRHFPQMNESHPFWLFTVKRVNDDRLREMTNETTLSNNNEKSDVIDSNTDISQLIQELNANTTGIVEARLYNSNGSLVCLKKETDQFLETLRSLSKGVYIVQLVYNNGTCNLVKLVNTSE